MSRAQGVVKRPSEVLTQVAGNWGTIDEPPDYEPANILGTTLGVYRLDGILGSGAVGVVYKAWDTRCNRIVALKLLRAGLLATADDRRRFRQEALALGRLSHANVTTILDFGSAYGRDYLVMEFVPGQTLSELLDGEPMASGQVAYLGEQLANGLEAAHLAGVVHRDIKPQNLRLTPDGQLKILDFGLARDDTPERTQDTSEGGIVGTVPYMAPEQLAGDRVGPRTDVYGAGAVLYELACGRRPFVADTVESLVNMIRYETPPRPSAINPSIWPSLEAVIVRALAKEPDARIESARALGEALSVAGLRSSVDFGRRSSVDFGRRSSVDGLRSVDGLGSSVAGLGSSVAGLGSSVAGRQSTFHAFFQRWHLRCNCGGTHGQNGSRVGSLGMGHQFGCCSFCDDRRR